MPTSLVRPWPLASTNSTPKARLSPHAQGSDCPARTEPLPCRRPRRSASARGLPSSGDPARHSSDWPRSRSYPRSEASARAERPTLTGAALLPSLLGPAGTARLERPLLGAWAKRNTRSRRCGAPTSSAEKHPHSASHPSSASSPSTRTIGASRSRFRSGTRIPGTFSRKNHSGSTSRRIRRVAGQRLRGSSPRSLLPARLFPWHGIPAETRSTTPRQGRPSKEVTSSQIGAQSRVWSSIRAKRAAAA
ncbi:hypothetical protein D3C86_1445530 [compost metagenome]